MRYAEIGVHDLTGKIGSAADIQAELSADKRGGKIGAHPGTHCLAGCSVQPGRQVHRQHGTGRAVDRLNAVKVVALHGAGEPGAEHRVHHQLRFITECSRPGLHPPVAGSEVLECQSGISLQLGWFRQRRHLHRQTGLHGETRDDVTIAAVVAATAKNQPVPGIGVSLAPEIENHPAGPGHQFVAFDSQRADRDAIELANLFGQKDEATEDPT